MAPDCVPDHFPKFFHALGLGEDVMVKGPGLMAAFGRLLDGENDLSFCHISALDYTLPAFHRRRTGGRSFTRN